MTAPLTWDDLLQHCSRSRGARTGVQDAVMLPIVADGTSALVVPTRMHEPGFYVRSDGQSDDHWSWRSDEQLATFRRMVDDGRVYLDDGGPAS